MAKDRKPRCYRRLRQPPRLNTGFVRIGDGSLSIPLEYAAYIGRPASIDLLVDDETRSLIIIASTTKEARTLRYRARRYRCYADLAADERPLLRQGLYAPVAEHDRVVKERVLKLTGAVL